MTTTTFNAENFVKQEAAFFLDNDPRFKTPDEAWNAAISIKKARDKAIAELVPTAENEMGELQVASVKRLMGLRADAAEMAANVVAGRLPRCYLETETEVSQ